MSAPGTDTPRQMTENHVAVVMNAIEQVVPETMSAHRLVEVVALLRSLVSGKRVLVDREALASVAQALDDCAELLRSHNITRSANAASALAKGIRAGWLSTEDQER